VWGDQGAVGWRQNGGCGSFKFCVSSNAVIPLGHLSTDKNGEVDVEEQKDISTVELSMIQSNCTS
jgi:hypothetical protein